MGSAVQTPVINDVRRLEVVSNDGKHVLWFLWFRVELRESMYSLSQFSPIMQSRI